MTIDVDGFPVAYTLAGPEDAKTTAVLLQGWGTDFRVYDYIEACIADRIRLVRFDFPGFGGTPEPKEAWNVGQYAEFFCHFMEALGIKKAVLMGHSFGGRVIIKLAGNEETHPLPFEIEGIVLIDAAGIKAEQTPAQRKSVRRFKRLKKFFAIPAVHWFAPDVIDEWLKNQGSADYRNASPIMKKAMVMAISEDLSDLLPHIKEDTLLIWGANDTATPLKDGKKMEALIPDSGLCVIENAGHFSFAEQPAVFAGIMANYFPAGSSENLLK